MKRARSVFGLRPESTIGRYLQKRLPHLHFGPGASTSNRGHHFRNDGRGGGGRWYRNGNARAWHGLRRCGGNDRHKSSTPRARAHDTIRRQPVFLLKTLGNEFGIGSEFPIGGDAENLLPLHHRFPCGPLLNRGHVFGVKRATIQTTGPKRMKNSARTSQARRTRRLLGHIM